MSSARPDGGWTSVAASWRLQGTGGVAGKAARRGSVGTRTAAGTAAATGVHLAQHASAALAAQLRPNSAAPTRPAPAPPPRPGWRAGGTLPTRAGGAPPPPPPPPPTLLPLLTVRPPQSRPSPAGRPGRCPTARTARSIPLGGVDGGVDALADGVEVREVCGGAAHGRQLACGVPVSASTSMR